ncbi:hypothetical protein CCB80_05225 [Armatimonadetes bacterium Uphvl-Ar1]|nr:hypothetical protein CCB80_05225 [Armatimonadetes bacterium Uphvl-Ar1]
MFKWKNWKTSFIVSGLGIAFLLVLVNLTVQDTACEMRARQLGILGKINNLKAKGILHCQATWDDVTEPDDLPFATTATDISTSDGTDYWGNHYGSGLSTLSVYCFDSDPDRLIVIFSAY